ncbi:MAG: SAM-dependent methyltransferase [Campylobacterales bacterium]
MRDLEDLGLVLKRFSEFFSEWLYGEGGYYRDSRRVGKKGDFYTSVSVSRLFGGAIAKDILQIDKKELLGEKFAIVEVGAEKGYLLADIIQTIYTLDKELLKRVEFFTVEPISELRETQNSYFKNSFGDEIVVKCVERFEDIGCNVAYIISNELFDAFPIELYKDGQMLYMDGFEKRFKKATKTIAEIANKYNIHRGEIPIGYREFAKNISNCFQKSMFVTFDYGDIEFRDDISLRVYRGHDVVPFFDEGMKIEEFYKKSDITYDVAFRFLGDEFAKEGFVLEEFKTQNVALVDFGITELLEMIKVSNSNEAYFAEANRVKMLLSPAFLGERFKMARFSKGISGFNEH